MQFAFRELFSCVGAVMFLTSLAQQTCSDDSNDEICHITIKNNSTKSVTINLENPRKTLKCKSCDIYVLADIFCENSSKVEKIDFSHSHITNIKNVGGSHWEFENVHTLNLSHNEIDEFKMENNVFLVGFIKLATLDLSYNNIRILYQAFNQYLLLSYLDLSHNKIVSLFPEYFITKTPLRIPSVNVSVFFNLDNLAHLDLSFNAITSIDNNSFLNLFSLKELLLSHNLISTFHFNINLNTPTLEVLNLSNNGLNDLKVGDVSTKELKLRHFDLSNNYLTGDLSLDNVYNLQYLNVSNNRITSITMIVAFVLEILDISNNNLNRYNCENLEALRKLYLAHNNLTSIKNISSSKLHTLDLSFNQLNDLNASTLSRFKALQHLKLQQSGLPSVDTSTFAAQSHLSSLDISYNNLKSFDLKKSFLGNKILTELFLDGNGLTALDLDNVSKHFPSLKRIGISDNAWSCNYLLTLLQQLADVNIEYVNSKLPAAFNEYIARDGCVKNVTLSVTQSHVDRNIDSEAHPPVAVTTESSELTDDNRNQEVIVPKAGKEKDETQYNVVQNIDSEAQPPVAVTTESSELSDDKRNQEVSVRKVDKVTDKLNTSYIPVNDNHLEVIFQQVFFTLIIISLIGVVIVLLGISILMLYKQRRRRLEFSFDGCTPMVDM